MEVAPKYWQYPQMLDRIYFSTAAGNASGTQQTQAPGATVSGVTPYSAYRLASGRIPDQFPERQAPRPTRSPTASPTAGAAAPRGSADSTAAETMVPLPAMATLRQQPHRDPGQSPERAGCRHHFLQPAAGRLVEQGRRRRSPRRCSISACRPPSTAASPARARLCPVHVGDAAADCSRRFGAVYIVLGILYENTVHPLTILSTLPSARIGATLALLIFGTPFSVIAFIGIILLIGIVKKNAIMMIDVAIHLQREEGEAAQRAIHDAAVVRLRPIMMTTAAAVLGALPLAIGIGQGASLRQPLGITVIGRPDLQPGVHLVHDARDLSGLRTSADMVAYPVRRRAPAEWQRQRGGNTMTRRALFSSMAVMAGAPARCFRAAWSAPTITARMRRSRRSSRTAPRGLGESLALGLRAQGDWWTQFHDPLLDGSSPRSRSRIRRCVEYANYLEAVAEVKVARAQLFPTLGLTGTVNRSGGPGYAGAVSPPRRAPPRPAPGRRGRIDGTAPARHRTGTTTTAGATGTRREASLPPPSRDSELDSGHRGQVRRSSRRTARTPSPTRRRSPMPRCPSRRCWPPR